MVAYRRGLVRGSVLPSTEWPRTFVAVLVVADLDNLRFEEGNEGDHRVEQRPRVGRIVHDAGDDLGFGHTGLLVEVRVGGKGCKVRHLVEGLDWAHF